MTELYGGKEMTEIKNARRLYLFALLGAILLTATVCTLSMIFIRPASSGLAQFVNILITSLFFCVALFVYAVKYRYLKNYYKMLVHIKTGIHKTDDGIFVRYETSLTDKDGIDFRVIIVKETVVKRPDLPERRILLDKFMDAPDFKEGARIKYTTCGGILIAYELIVG